MIKKFIETLENLELKKLDRLAIIFFIIFLRNLLESQFEFPGFIGFVKLPVDSFFAFFLHFPLFYLALFYTLYKILSWLRGEKEKVANVLCIGFSVILIPPLFDYIVMGKTYHLSYFFEFESYARGLVGIALPWIKGVGNISIGQRLEVYLSNLLVFGYLLICGRGFFRAGAGFMITHFIIAGIGAVGIILTPFMQKNWLCFSHHQIFIQVFSVYLILLYTLDHKFKFFDPPGLNIVFFILLGIIYCLKIKLPPTLSPFIFSSIICLVFCGWTLFLGIKNRDFILTALGLCLAISVRYETLIFAVLLILVFYIKSINKLKIADTVLAGVAAVSGLFISTSLFFFYHTISLTPTFLVLFVFLAGFFVSLFKNWWQIVVIYVVLFLITIFSPAKPSIDEHTGVLNATNCFRIRNYQNCLRQLKDLKLNNIVNFLFGISLINLGNAESGLPYLGKITELDRDIIYAKLAGYNQLNRYRDGLTIIDQGIKNGIMVDELYLEKIRQLILLKDFSEAKVNVERAYAFGAKKEECLTLFGDINFYQGNYNKAIALYNEVQNLKPTNYYAYAQEGMAQYALAQSDSAINLFIKAIALNNTDPVVHNNFGVVLRTVGRFGEARNEFLTALKLAPIFIDGYYNLGLLSSLENKRSEAICWYNKALEINPQFIPAKEALTQIEDRP